MYIVQNVENAENVVPNATCATPAILITVKVTSAEHSLEKTGRRKTDESGATKQDKLRGTTAWLRPIAAVLTAAWNAEFATTTRNTIPNVQTDKTLLRVIQDVKLILWRGMYVANKTTWRATPAENKILWRASYSGIAIKHKGNSVRHNAPFATNAASVTQMKAAPPTLV